VTCFFGGTVALSCSSSSDDGTVREPEDPRPQIVLLLDTDMPTPSDLAANPGVLSPAAAIDTLRVDVFDDAALKGTAPAFVNVFAVPDRQAWPVSFGVAGKGGSVLVRARLFRASFALTVADASSDAAVPDPNVTVDRLIRVDLPPTSGVRVARVRLRGDCIGTPASLLAEQSCVDETTRMGEARAAVEIDPQPESDRKATLVGTWPLARIVPCKDPPAARRKCVPGGFTILGDREASGLFGLTNTLPLKPAYVEPFYIDETEVSVLDYVNLRENVKVEVRPEGNDPARRFREFCTLRMPSTAEDDADNRALNCIAWEGARQICAARGGKLPSEAEWELAARGFEQRKFPWGDNQPLCCTASIGRVAYAEFRGSATCKDGTGPEVVASHTKALDPKCGYYDVTPATGILDMAGSMQELTSDNYLPYSHPCWGVGLVRDPHCNVPLAESETHTARGAGWSQGPLVALAAVRHPAGSINEEVGFRCRYNAEPGE